MSADTTNAGVVEVTDVTFAAEVEGAQGLVLVDFGAAWCGPCRMMDPAVKQIAGDYAGRVKVAKVDTDANLQVSTRFNIRSLPTFLIFRDGKVVDQVIGAVPRQAIENKLAALL
ncbi:thioredoxin [Longimicrobium sp.]|uniref:thioredoxin n=1 Tax=Longimicrobium sp. TaxID=2029185 RepID=UPI002F9278CC